jgi:L-fucose isomerase
MQMRVGNRLRTPLPKVGIRPIIDGRYGGVRESLEGPAIGMAKAAADLIESRLRHASGEAVECVIAETCISNAAEAATAEAQFERAGVGVSLSVTPCWCYGSETVDMHPTRPKAIWGFNGTERPGAVYLAAALAAHAQKGIPCFGIYGRGVQDLGSTEIPADVEKRLLQFVRSAIAAATMRGTSYLAMGGTSMGIAGSTIVPEFFEQYLGMRVVQIDMSEFSGRIRTNLFDQEEFERAMQWVGQYCQEGVDHNAPEKQRSQQLKREDWETSVKMVLIARDLMIGNPRLAEMGYLEQSIGHNAIASGFQGQRQWTDYYPNGDFMEAILCSSFDWNGIRQPFIFATENDTLNAVSMLFGHLLTGTAQLFSDVRTYWSSDAIKRISGHEGQPMLHLINSGPSALDWTGEAGDKPCVKPWWTMTQEDVESCLKATKWCPSMTEYFPGGGWSTDFKTRAPMPATMCRVNWVSGLGPVLQIAEGDIIQVDDAIHDRIDLRTNPTWPTTYFAPRLTGQFPFDDVYHVMLKWGANHGAVCYGHIASDLVTLASILRIPVEMHNLATADIFRPGIWDRFGSMDLQSADFSACKLLGPTHK